MKICNNVYPPHLRIYTSDGKRLDKMQKGVNIVVMQDGTTRKVVVR